MQTLNVAAHVRPATEERDMVARRIACLDGMRSLAVLGVVWAHVWSFCETPSIIVGRFHGVVLDVHRVISAVGTGVDLFFVLSGFFMFVMFARHSERTTPTGYVLFLRRRWLRLAPAYYVAVLACALGFAATTGRWLWLSVIGHLAFVHTFSGTLFEPLAAPFWSLATEWHFYVVLPLLLLIAARIGVRVAAFAMIAACVAFRAIIHLRFEHAANFWDYQLATRIAEFMWGILVGQVFMLNAAIPRIFHGSLGFLIGGIIMFSGRMLMVHEVVGAAGQSGWILETLNHPILTFGYAIMVISVLTGKSAVQRFFSSAIATWIGRISYSVYLWHWWPCLWLSKRMTQALGSNVAAQYAAFLLSLAILLPASWLSYRLLELPYFRRRSGQKR